MGERGGNVLADLLVAEGGQLGGARAHDVVRGGDEGLVPGESKESASCLHPRGVDCGGPTYSPCSILDWKTWRWCSMLMTSGLVLASVSALGCIDMLTSRAASTLEADIVVRCLGG